MYSLYIRSYYEKATDRSYRTDGSRKNPSIHSEEYFKEFLSNPKNMENPKAEFFIPLMVNKLINEGTATVEVLDTTSKWFGVTYAADREATVEKIASLVAAGEYPEKLF